MSIQCVVGLGNPGESYAKTRHNIGFMFAKTLIRRVDAQAPKKMAFQSHVYRLSIHDHDVMVLMPRTYMNASGDAVLAVTNFYQWSPDGICVVTDDLDIPFGRLRIRQKGGPGTHNGMKSIIDRLKTQDIPRIRLGIGPKPPHLDANQVVMVPFSQSEQSVLPAMLNAMVDQFIMRFRDPLPTMMNHLNPVEYV